MSIFDFVVENYFPISTTKIRFFIFLIFVKMVTCSYHIYFNRSVQCGDHFNCVKKLIQIWFSLRLIKNTILLWHKRFRCFVMMSPVKFAVFMCCVKCTIANHSTNFASTCGEIMVNTSTKVKVINPILWMNSNFACYTAHENAFCANLY